MFSDGGGYWRHEGWGEPAALNDVVPYVYDQHGSGSDPGDVYYIRSTNSGVTFSAPLKLNTDATTTSSVAAQPFGQPEWQPLGRVVRRARERQLHPWQPEPPCYRMWARRSTDNGATWLSDQTFSDVVSPLPAQPDPGFRRPMRATTTMPPPRPTNTSMHGWTGA